MNNNQITYLLKKGLGELEIALGEAKIQRLMEYLALFYKWNKAYNLSAVRELNDMVVLHLLDSLSVLPYLVGQRFIDVGTGGGLPGMPLAIALPDTQWTLLDSAGKKTRFLHQVTTELGIENVQIQNCRVEQYQPEHLFDGVISRAFASLKDMTDGCQHLIHRNGRLWAMKGRFPQDELSLIEKHYNVEHSYAIRVPNLEAERCLLVLQPKT